MITERQIDIFKSGAQTICIPCNTVGIMGKGLALAFKQKFPEIKLPYQNACFTGLFDSEGLFVYQSSTYRILCFPTKRHWKYPSRLEWIDEGLELLSLHYEWYGISSISLPSLGCSNGGLDWSDVRSLIYKYFEHHPLEVEIIPPRY